MTKQELEQQFLNDLDKRLWNAADRLRNSLDAANYKHIVLGLIFLKYISDTFLKRREALLVEFKDEASDYYLGADASDALIEAELEERDYYTAQNIFWVPRHARWDFLKERSALAFPQTIIDASGNETKITSVNRLIDNAFDEIENANTKLKGILNRISGYQLADSKLAELITAFSLTDFNHPEYKGQKVDLESHDILGHVYEYFLGKFALAEGKNGGQYYTPKSIVNLIVEMLQPYEGRVYDPAMGSGGFFVSNMRFIEKHSDTKHYNAREQKQNISIYGQESNPTTWKLAAMNLAIRGIDFNIGKQNGDTFTNDQHPDLKADFIMANPPFNMNEWWHESLEGDRRWQYGTPPEGNANFAWMQHMIYHLAPSGSMALLLANGSMSSMTNQEGTIREAILKADLVECMVALPGQLFTNTQIPACIWFLTRDKGDNPQKGRKNRQGKTLFIDARDVGYMKDRVLRDFKPEDIDKIADTFHAWQQGEGYENIAGFCYEADLDEIAKNDYVLTPGRYVGAPEAEEDTEPFDEKMARLTATLKTQFAESAELEDAIRENLKGIGYEF